MVLYQQCCVCRVVGRIRPGNLFSPAYLSVSCRAGLHATQRQQRIRSAARVARLRWASLTSCLRTRVGPRLADRASQRCFSVPRRFSLATVREGMNVWTAGGGLYGANQGLTVDDSVSPRLIPRFSEPAGSVYFQRSDPAFADFHLNPTPSYPIPSCSGCSVNGVDPNLKMGYVQSWNFSFQRELDRQHCSGLPLHRESWRRPVAEIDLNEVNTVKQWIPERVPGRPE